ncbi:MAG: type I-E CRISPR-associated protein Cas7/Cse4/CasC [Myxococcales bacterium]|nr:type I-E CRISPR-associated protein Cas7/Cse4/CasC [Myxococcota bacterium]MDW8284360.1 type I-E CRISPR-associated protein Cas7/Cse4/CasC [Myxococcales bacterium]
MFLQIHSLTSYHATLLNRDDAGLAKRIPFGDAVRLRVSSQCLKRHWREKLQDMLDLPGGLRTRHFFSREVLRRLVEERGVDAALAEKLVRQLGKALITTSDGSKDPLDETLQMKQPVLFGRPEADFLVDLLAQCAAEGEPEKALGGRLKTNKENFQAMLRQAGHDNLFAGIEGALFGRFVTSDILSRRDAAVHVAHAFTVHKLDTEVDYFTVVDDLNREEETGAAHAGDMELGAGLFYGYVTVDIPLLVSNFTGCDSKDWTEQDLRDVCAVLDALVRAIATVSPGAKLGATAPYAYSDFIMLETGRQQPRSLANAYLKALPARGDLMQTAVDALARHVRALDGMYGKTADLRVAATTRNLEADIAPTQPLDAAIQTALNAVFGEKCHARAPATL